MNLICTIFVLFFRCFTFVYRSKMTLDKLQKLHIGLSFVEMVQFLTNNYWFAIILKIPYPVIKLKHFTTLLNLAKLTPITTNWFIEKWEKMIFLFKKHMQQKSSIFNSLLLDMQVPRNLKVIVILVVSWILFFGLRTPYAQF